MKSKGLFILPFYASKRDESAFLFLEEALRGIHSQSCDNWNALVINDASDFPSAETRLRHMCSAYGERVIVKSLRINMGPGHARNLGIMHAQENGFDCVLYNDSDDISHPERLLETLKIFDNGSNDVDVVYSPFFVIDENSNLVEEKSIPSEIKEILDNYTETEIPEGDDVWKIMGTKTGYLNITSSTSVKTSLAAINLFPHERVSEDFHTWLRLSASGGRYRFVSNTPTYYRVRLEKGKQNSRAAIGNSRFNQLKIENDQKGFEQAINIASVKSKIKYDEINILMLLFYKRLVRSMVNHNEKELLIGLKKKVNYFTNTL